MAIAERPRLRRAAVCWLAAGATICVGPARALDYQVHGFLAQGFVLSEHNDFYGDSTGGSFEFYEAGLNGTIKPLPSLLVSAQVLARDAGATDDGKPRLDYGFLDHTFPGASGDAGVRAGRVKNPYGLYNDTRDVVFARPGVLLPQSVYFESQGARSLLFASDGLQAYGGFTRGEHYTSLVATWAPDKTLRDDEAERLIGDSADDGDVRIEDFHFARLLTDWNGGHVTTALSYVHGLLDFRPDAGVPLDYGLRFTLYTLSARYSGRRFSVTSEYGLTDSRGTFETGGPPAHFDAKSEGIYVQGDWLLTPAWTVIARWDSTFSNRNDRDGDACSTGFGAADRHQCFAHDASLGARWHSPQHWGVFAEYHYIDGLATASARDNEGDTLRPHWSMLVLMAAYRF
jgi:hypothetical protein